jgi:hypothetical protein
VCLRVCLGVIVYLQGQQQRAAGKKKENEKQFSAEGEKTRAGIRAAVSAFGIHNGHTITRCHTMRKKKVSHGANFFCPYFLAAFASYCAKASATRECANLIDPKADCFSMSERRRFPAAS